MARGARVYRGIAVASATSWQLLDEVMIRLETRIHDAKRALDEGDVPSRSAAINDATDLVMALSGALEEDKAPELVANLAALYGFVHARLLQAHTRNDTHALDEAFDIVRTIHEGFAQAGSGRRL